MEEEAVAVGAAGLAMLEMEMEEELEAVLAEAVGLAEAAAAMHAPPAPPHRAAPGRTAATPPLSGGGAGIQGVARDSATCKPKPCGSAAGTQEWWRSKSYWRSSHL